MIRRIFLFVLTNIAILAMVSILLSVFNVSPYLTPYGLDYQSLLIFAAIFGFSGSIFSLLISKWMAKFAYHIRIITQPQDRLETEVFQMVQNLSQAKNIGMPEFGIYDSPEVNAFATGWNKNKALVAVSSGLLESMDKDEIEGVIGHEISHIANGDMITMALLQGVLNTFVIFFARIAAHLVQLFLRKDEEDVNLGGFAYMITSWIFEILFGILASLILFWFSRKREYRADAGSASALGKQKMILALRRLSSIKDDVFDNRSKSFATMKINNKSSLLSLFSTHPDLEDRIARLEQS